MFESRGREHDVCDNGSERKMLSADEHDAMMHNQKERNNEQKPTYSIFVFNCSQICAPSNRYRRTVGSSHRSRPKRSKKKFIFHYSSSAFEFVGECNRVQHTHTHTHAYSESSRQNMKEMNSVYFHGTNRQQLPNAIGFRSINNVVIVRTIRDLNGLRGHITELHLLCVYSANDYLHQQLILFLPKCVLTACARKTENPITIATCADCIRSNAKTATKRRFAFSSFV